MSDTQLTEDGIFSGDSVTPQPKKKPAPLYRVYAESRVAVSKAVGKAMRTRLDAALAAYDSITTVWDQVLQYYNHNQNKTMTTPRGVFRRGDSSENVVFSNLNIMLPATYSKNPDVTCNTTDKGDVEFCRALEALLTTLFKRKDKLAAKDKVKKAAGFALLTNFGVLKLDFTQKDQSRELAIDELSVLSKELAKAKDIKEVEALTGKLMALEAQMEVSEPSGPKLSNVLPHNLIIDPYAELPDGSDANWMIERCFLPTEYLQARFAQKDPEGDGQVLVYKPTHKASLNAAVGSRDDGLGLVMDAIDQRSGDGHSPVEGHTTEERLSFLYTYMTECYWVWDKPSRRVMLFQRDDWSWPLWVWDDPFNSARFFPYFIMQFAFSTGGTVSVGETAYYLDQQDEINDINRQVSKIRRSIFDYWLYNSDKVKKDEIEPLLNGLRGESGNTKHIVGIKLGEMKLEDVVGAVPPPSVKYEELFNKEAIFKSIDRIGNTSDALRGVQFKTNTNEKAVETYQDSVKLVTGAKVDVIEDTVSDVALMLAEMCIQFLDQVTVAGLIGEEMAKGWKEMTVAEFHASYSLEIVAGSTEKPNSLFKKKEAVQVAQAVGQFAAGAPGTSMKIMLKVLQQAFTEIVIHDEDWAELDAEIQSMQQKGISTGAAPAAAGGTDGVQPGSTQPQQGAQAQGDAGAQIDQLLAAADPATKERAAAAVKQGATPQQIVAMLQGGASGGPQRQRQQRNGRSSARR